MIICVLLIVFSFAIVLFGGNNKDAARLYYDTDFAELYDTSDQSSGERKFKGGKAYSAEDENKQESSETSKIIEFKEPKSATLEDILDSADFGTDIVEDTAPKEENPLRRNKRKKKEPKLEEAPIATAEEIYACIEF